MSLPRGPHWPKMGVMRLRLLPRLPLPPLLLLAACRAPAERPSTGVAAGSDTAPTADTALTVDTAPLDDSAPSDDTAPEVDVEDVPQAPEPPLLTEQLCQLELDCETTVTAEKTSCNLRVIREDGTVDDDGAAVAWWRGRSSFWVAKHSYGIELRDEKGESRGADLLGMGSDPDWVIDGLYYDRLLVRDKLGYDLFRSFAKDGPTAAESALCELTLDGTYIGVVALVERIKRDDDRLDLDPANDGESFVMKQIDEDCFRWNTTTYGCFKLISPDDGDLSPNASATLTAFLDGWEAAVVADDPFAKSGGVLAYADMDSAIDLILIEELFKNEDCFYTSLHLWKDKGGTVRWVPWDLDMTFGQFPDYYDYGNPERWIQYRPEMWTVWTEHPDFHARLAARWAELRAGPLASDALHSRIDALQLIMGDAIDRNFEVWPIESIQYGSIFYPVTSYEDEDSQVRAWMDLRLAFMDANIGTW
jgi:CotH kinase protein